MTNDDSTVKRGQQGEQQEEVEIRWLTKGAEHVTQAPNRVLRPWQLSPIRSAKCVVQSPSGRDQVFCDLSAPLTLYCIRNCRISLDAAPTRAHG